MDMRSLLTATAAFLCVGAATFIMAQEQGSQQNSSQAPALPASTVDSQGIRNYLLGPGDVLDIRVFGQSDFNTQSEVDTEGNLNSLPFVETPIRARCRTEKDIQKDVSVAYSKYLKDPQVSVRIVGRNSRQPAVVYGAVGSPSRVQMQRRVRLSELIAVSGGITERARGVIQIVHTEPVMCPEPGEVVDPSAGGKGNLYQIAQLKEGKPEADPVIRPGDVVNIVEAEPIYITGSVVAPQPMYLKTGLTLGRALAMVGGVKHEGKATDVRIYRQKPGSSEQTLIKVDYLAIKKKQKEDVALLPYDIIEVPEASRLSRGRVLDTLTQSALSATSTLMGAFPQGLAYHVIY